MEIAIFLVAAVIFFICACCTESSTIYALMITGILFSGIFFFSALGAPVIIALILGAILAGVCWFFSGGGTSSSSSSTHTFTSSPDTCSTGINMANPAVKCIIDETIKVLQDMLDAGFGIHLLAHFQSNIDYEGFILYGPTWKPPKRHGKNYYAVYLYMKHVSNLKLLGNNRPKWWTHPNWQDVATKTEHFICRYGNYYNSNEESYCYETSATISLKKDEVDQFTALLTQQIKTRCPKAIVSASGRSLHTDGVAYG